MGAYLIDPFEFCRKGESLDGRVPLDALKRLATLCVDTSGELAWRISGFLDSHQKPRLLLAVAGRVHLVCQRCLGPLAFILDSETTVIVAKTEGEADEMESSWDEGEAVEVVVSDGKINVMDLIEDEALLALPLSPRHDVCPDSSMGAWKEERQSPFSVLKDLKRKE